MVKLLSIIVAKNPYFWTNDWSELFKIKSWILSNYKFGPFISSLFDD